MPPPQVIAHFCPNLFAAVQRILSPADTEMVKKYSGHEQKE
jgi:hypothetical protein